VGRLGLPGRTAGTSGSLLGLNRRQFGRALPAGRETNRNCRRSRSSGPGIVDVHTQLRSQGLTFDTYAHLLPLPRCFTPPGRRRQLRYSMSRPGREARTTDWMIGGSSAGSGECRRTVLRAGLPGELGIRSLPAESPGEALGGSTPPSTSAHRRLAGFVKMGRGASERQGDPPTSSSECARFVQEG